MQKMRIMVVDDHPIIHQALELGLEHEFGALVRGAYDGKAALELADTFKPDVAVVDFNLPGVKGPVLVNDLCCQKSAPRIVIFSARSDIQSVRQALVSGAVGYVHKQGTLDELFCAVRAALAGEVYLSNTLRLYAGDLTDGTSLTVRESEVLELIANGLKTKEIAEQLHISPRTVESHRKQLYLKTGAKSLPDLIRYCLVSGMFEESI